MSSEEERWLSEIKRTLRHFYATRVKVTIKEGQNFPVAFPFEKSLPKAGRSGGRAIFKFLVYKQLLLSQFELILCSNNLSNDPKWCKEALNSIFQLMESFNGVVSDVDSPCQLSVISLADMCDTLVLSRGFMASVTLATCDNCECMSELVELEWNITVSVIVSIVHSTSVSLRLQSTSNEDLLLLCNDWSVDSAFLLANPKLNEFINIIWGRVWQETGRRLVPMILSMGTRIKEAVRLLHQLIEGIGCRFPPVGQCLLYVIRSIDTRDRLNMCYSDSCKRNVNLSSFAKPSMLPIGSCILADVQKEFHIKQTRNSSLGTGIEQSVNVEDKVSSEQQASVIADESNVLLLTSPFIHILHCSLWTPDQKIIHSLKQSLSCDDLPGIVHLVFGVGMEMRRQRKDLVEKVGAIATPKLHLPMESPQYWIAKRSMEAHTRLHDHIKHSEFVSDNLWERFLFQWRNKCRLMLDTPKVWKKLEKKKGVDPSAYVIPIKEQLVLPLSSACGGLSAIAQCVCVFLTFTILLMEIWNSIQKQSNRMRYSANVYSIILSDCRHLQLLLANSLHHSNAKEIVYHLPAYGMLEKKLNGHCSAGEDLDELISNNPCVQETITMIQGIPPFKVFLDGLKWK